MRRWLLLAAALACRPKPEAPLEPLDPGRPATPAAPLPVWIDTDPSVGEPDRDVDDGLALLQALRSPELAIHGVSTVFGNAPLDRADPIARELLGAWSPTPPPILRGADGPGLTPTEASRGLVAALEARSLTILVLGPATNVAAALTARPDLAPRVREVIAVAGRYPGQRFTTGATNPRAHRDFNFEQDPEAFRVLLAADVPLTLAPFELSRKVWVREPFLTSLEGGHASRRLVEPARGWLALWTRAFGVDGFNPFDTLAIGLLVRPELITCAPKHAAIEVGPDDVTERAMQGVEVPTKPYLVVYPPEEEPGAPVRWCHDVHADAFLDDLGARLLRP